jgi:hypothetical protein
VLLHKCKNNHSRREFPFARRARKFTLNALQELMFSSMAACRLRGVSPNGVPWKYEGHYVTAGGEYFRHGFGVCFWDNGDRYEGQWANDKTNGCGVYTQGDGARYDGEFVDHKMHGFGICVFPDGDKHEGIWKEGSFFLPQKVSSQFTDAAFASANQARLASQSVGQDRMFIEIPLRPDFS